MASCNSLRRMEVLSVLSSNPFILCLPGAWFMQPVWEIISCFRKARQHLKGLPTGCTVARYALLVKLWLVLSKLPRKVRLVGTKGVWLTKSTNNDVHMVAFGEHVFCARSIRRLPRQWDLKLAADVTAEPWHFGFAPVWVTSCYPPRGYFHLRSEPIPLPMPEPCFRSWFKPDAAPVVIPDHRTLDELARQAPNARHEDEAGQLLRPDLPLGIDVTQSVDTSMNETPPMSSGVARGEDAPHEESDRALKAPRLNAPDQQMMLVSQECESAKLVCQVLALDHEDEPNPTHFEQGELDDLPQDYDVGLELEEDDALHERCFRLALSTLQWSRAQCSSRWTCYPWSVSRSSRNQSFEKVWEFFSQLLLYLKARSSALLLDLRTWRDKFMGN